MHTYIHEYMHTYIYAYTNRPTYIHVDRVGLAQSVACPPLAR